jgi:hypothetical protein
VAEYLGASFAGIGDAFDCVIANRTAFIFHQASLQAGPKQNAGPHPTLFNAGKHWRVS